MVVESIQQLACKVDDGTYLLIQECEEGYDYTFYDSEKRLKDGGILENPDCTIEEAVRELLEDAGTELEFQEIDYEDFLEDFE